MSTHTEKIDKGNTWTYVMIRTARFVNNHKICKHCSVRKIAKEYKINHSALWRYVKSKDKVSPLLN
jgi:hypothetical protein